MNLVKDFAQRIIEFLQEKMIRLRKMKRKNKWKLAGVVLAVVLVVVVVGRLAVGRRGSRNASAETTVQSATAEIGSISTTVEGTGTLQQGTAENVTVPVGIKIEEVLVEAGDAVTAGQQLATVNTASVAAQLLEVEENLDDVKDEIADLSDDADEEGTTEYLEALVLKEERKELRQAKKALKTLLNTGVIEADSDGIIGEVYVSEDTEVTNSSDSSGSVSASSTSSASTVTATNTAAVKTLSSGGAVTAISLSSDETTETETITTCSLTVTAPVTGNVPQSSITGTDEYTGTISWNCSESTFQAGIAYTATIELTANTGYGFSSATTVSVSGAASLTKTVSEDGSSMTIYATFAATANSNSSEETEGTTNSSDSSNTGETAGTSGNDSSSSESTTENKNSGANGSTDLSNGTNGTGAAGGTAGSSSAAGGTSTASVSTDSTDSSASSGDEYSLYEAVAFSIIDEEEAIISIQVDELDILSVEEGQTATITMDAVEDQEFEGTITNVSTTASGDSSSAKYSVEITMEKTDEMLYGMSASATIQVEEAENAVLIPVNALQEEGNSTFVYTESDDDGNLSGEVEVTTGLSDGSQVEITSGLEEGDTVYYLRTGTDSDDSDESGLPSMGGDMGGDMPSGGQGGSDGGGGAGGPGGNPGGSGQ